MRLITRKNQELVNRIDERLRDVQPNGEIVTTYTVYYRGSKMAFCESKDYWDAEGNLVHTVLKEIFAATTNDELENMLTGYLSTVGK